jgi:hypothetical protein
MITKQFGRVFAALALLVLGFAGCKEVEPPPTVEDRIQGVWVRKYLNLTNTYNFHDGACDSYAVIPGQPYQYYGFAYRVESDTLTMTNLASLEKSKHTVTFTSDTTVTLSRHDGIDYFLKRE